MEKKQITNKTKLNNLKREYILNTIMTTNINTIFSIRRLMNIIDGIFIAICCIHFIYGLVTYFLGTQTVVTNILNIIIFVIWIIIYFIVIKQCENIKEFNSQSRLSCYSDVDIILGLTTEEQLNSFIKSSLKDSEVEN